MNRFIHSADRHSVLGEPSACASVLDTFFDLMRFSKARPITAWILLVLVAKKGFGRPSNPISELLKPSSTPLLLSILTS